MPRTIYTLTIATHSTVIHDDDTEEEPVKVDEEDTVLEFDSREELDLAIDNIIRYARP